MAGTAEQQATVGGETEVIHRHVLVTDRPVAWQQARGAFGRERFGGDHVAAGRQDLGGEVRLQLIDVGVAAEHQGIGGDPASGGMHPYLGTVFQAGDLAVLEELHAQGLGRGSLAQGQVERMQVAGTLVHQGAFVALGADHLGQLVLGHQAQWMGIAQGLERGLFLLQVPPVTRLVGQVGEAPAEIAVDVMAGDTLADQIHRLEAQALEFAYPLGTYDRFELLDVVADAADQLTAIASAGSPADTPGFQQHHPRAALGQFQGGVEPGEATADHADIRLDLALQGRQVQFQIGGGGVVGGRVGLHRRRLILRVKGTRACSTSCELEPGKENRLEEADRTRARVYTE